MLPSLLGYYANFMNKPLVSTHPDLASEWHPTLNGGLTPNIVTSGSGKKYWWVGRCGHVWDSTINSRIIAQGCPVCSGRRVQKGVNDLQTTHPDLAAEWHPSLNGELEPDQLSRTSGKPVWWLGKCGHTWTNNIAQRVRVPTCPVCTGHRVQSGYNDLQTSDPEISSEWHPSRNEDLLPTHVSRGSGKIVWWLGECGHTWDSPVATKVRTPGCPICSGHRVQQGINDLATTNPKLAKEWDFASNKNIEPTNVSAGSNKKVWWIAACGHRWDAVIASRNSGHGCPYCAGNRLNEGVNDFASNFPNLLNEWHPSKNGDLNPSAISSNSKIKLWWKCQNGHEWQSTASNRAKGKGCARCKGLVAVAGETDLATLRPDIAKQWSKNNKKLASSIRPGSDYLALWVCDLGHEYRAAVKHRALSNSDCPYCAGKKVLSGFNDLETNYPDVASTWDFNSNEGVLPSHVIGGSHKKYYWLCLNGHSFSSTPDKQTRERTGCPYCAFRKLLIGFNDLQTQDPIVATEWDVYKNGIKPSNVIYGGQSKHWFKCAQGHSWKASLVTRKRSGCPDCATYGFKSGKPAHLYVIRNLSLNALKIGITNVKTSRLKDFRKAGWEILVTKDFEVGSEARDLEKTIKGILNLNISKEGYLSRTELGRLGGFTETVEWSEKVERRILRIVNLN